MSRRISTLGILALALMAGFARPGLARSAEAQAAPAPTTAEAQRFVSEAEALLLDLWIEAERASWVQSTFITQDTEILAAQANARKNAATAELAKRATRFDGLSLPPDVARKLKLLKLSLTLPAPSDPKENAELAGIVAGMESAYSTGKYCPGGEAPCVDLQEISDTMARSRDASQLAALWRGWHATAPPLRDEFARYVELANKGARELGFADTGAMWRSKYDMQPDDFAREVDRLWSQVKPLYDSLHCYVRSNLARTYGSTLVQEGKPISADLLGNMWAQDWTNIYPLVAPKGGDPDFDLTERLRANSYDAMKMVRTGERFFTSLGFAPLPDTFWQRSMITKPRDREVVCHASAWDIDWLDDLRLKMCVEIKAEDFATVHHELGHNFYQRAYSTQPPLFRDSANDGFHEAVGDTLALSITPPYLKRLGLIEREPDPSADIGLLLNQALDKVAFLPFGLLVDQWRWKVFSGEVTPERYNGAWWELRRRYQGVVAPVPRSEADFDPGAKYHVAANVPYTRYFLATILEFQFHRALCEAAGYQGPLHRCSIYANPEAGRRLKAMLEMGASRPWPDALEALTGQRQMDAGAMRGYFAPLERWLGQQNTGHACGW
ncbi:MAG: peptidyl-dipeptidase [Acidobacteria bacterium RBG_13_68_16]|nr:MAG: peptidyl-dipeptidase [Acidobacteria bacterium RBG_13_68_16]